MGTITKFEDLEVWKLARVIVNNIYELTKSGDFKQDYALKNQIRRSGLSILSNIGEGFESGTDKQFARYLKIAKGSAGECRAQIYIAFDQQYISQEEFRNNKSRLVTCSKQLSRLISYLNGNKVNEPEIVYGT